MPKYNFPSRRGEIDLTGLSFEHFPPKKQKMKIHADEWVGIIILGACVMYCVAFLLGV